MGKAIKPYIVENAEIMDISSEGMGVAKVNDLVIFVEGAVPGDVCDFRVYRKKKSFAFAKLTGLKKASEHRVKPECSYFGTCGGCKWQNLKYSSQLEFKQNQVTQAMKRLAKIEVGEILPILGCKEYYFYRNKLDFGFSNKKWLTPEQVESKEQFDNRNGLGFHIAGAFDKILDIEKCHLQIDISNQIRNEVRIFTLANGYTFFDIKNQNGLMRSLIIRTSSTGELMTIFSFFENDTEKINNLLNHIHKLFPQITSLLYVINPKGNDTIFDLPVNCFYGNAFIIEEMEGLKFKVGPKSFYQTNSKQAYELYKVTRSFAELDGNEIVYDLYTGTGTIAQFVSAHAKKVIGVEYIPEAIEDAKANALLNNINNCSFFAGDIKEVLNDEFIFTHGKPDLIITDPPRVGMDEKVVRKILEIAPKKIVYVSCNPASQARDLAILAEKYKVIKMRAVDMFPQTLHIENVALLQLI
ncbi:MAG TPA: 23S rRNA (uracil(1939)-C(5))-methyltransferase RlmD [Bacteroidia bacterium]|jgi:23S rRNA (uracil1939-C5)-methyltransferase|nr:23S rRNA (uracil(1939)-C(5))-methyltransferase RlmD [Bacteroidia bacterium]